MAWIVGLGFVLATAYAWLQLKFLRLWEQLPIAPQATGVNPRFSILVPARNEAEALPNCLRHVTAATANYPAEVLVIDDHSTDSTSAVARAAGVEVLSLPPNKSGKKAALEAGIEAATGSWIITLDADTCVPAHWLSTVVAYAKGAVAVAGPVHLGPVQNAWERWQALDFVGMMAITGASLSWGKWVMGNGANLAFAKTAFYAVDGYNLPLKTAVASGDDMVLLQKLSAQFPGQVHFAKDPQAAVTSLPQKNLAGFLQQRVRWSAKTGLNLQPSLTLALAVVWMFHTGLLVATIGLVGWQEWAWAVGLWWLIKWCVDLLLLRSATQFFRRKELLTWTYFIDSLGHATYIAVVGLLSLLPIQFTWKGRKAKY